MTSPIYDPIINSSESTATDQHRYMVTLLGVLYTFLVLVCFLLLAFKPLVAVLRWVNVGLCAIQIFVCIFFWFNPVWPVTLQLLLVALFGIFAALTHNPDHYKVFSYLTLFDTLIVLGFMAFLGYPNINLMDSLQFPVCRGYYDTDEPICNGYINYLRFLAFNLILMHPFELFFAYLVNYHIGDQDGAAGLTLPRLVIGGGGSGKGYGEIGADQVPPPAESTYQSEGSSTSS